MRHATEIFFLLFAVFITVAIVIIVIAWMTGPEKPKIEYPVSLEREDLNDYGPYWSERIVPPGARNIKSLGDHWIYFEYDGHRFLLRSRRDRSVLTSYGEVEDEENDSPDW